MFEVNAPGFVLDRAAASVISDIRVADIGCQHGIRAKEMLCLQADIRCRLVIVGGDTFGNARLQIDLAVAAGQLGLKTQCCKSASIKIAVSATGS